MEKNTKFQLWVKGRTPTVWTKTILALVCATLILGSPVLPAMAAPGKITKQGKIETKTTSGGTIAIINSPGSQAAAPEKTKSAKKNKPAP
ncbi:MAG: hypothetical protein PHU44_06040, partial [Syntrophales bacterium]|nr:hypothetical protein [Syntrophales bacterium]